MNSFIPAIIMKNKSTDYVVQYLEDVLLKKRVLFQSFSTDIPHYLNPILPPQWRIQGRGPGGPPPLILDQTKGRRKKLETGPPPTLSRGLDDRAPSYLKVWIRHYSQPEIPIRILKTSLLSLRSYVW